MSTTEIPAALVKELRDLTGAGMMDCKRALVESGGDLEAARQSLREKGLAEAGKRAGRETTEGRVLARVKDPKDLDYVRGEILAAIARAAKEPVAAGDLDEARSRMRYSFALSLDSSANIAANISEYVGLTRSPETIERVFALYQTVTPDDIRAAAARWLVDDNRTIVTLRSAASAGGGKEAGK